MATPERDEHLASWAPKRAAGYLKACAIRQAGVDAPQTQEEHKQRYLHTWWDDERAFLNFEGMLPRELGETFEKAVLKAAHSSEIEETSSPRFEERMADALVRLVGGSPAGGRDPVLVVHVDVERLLGSEGVAETESGVQLATETVHRQMCLGPTEWVLEVKGRPIGVGKR